MEEEKKHRGLELVGESGGGREDEKEKKEEEKEEEKEVEKETQEEEQSMVGRCHLCLKPPPLLHRLDEELEEETMEEETTDFLKLDMD